MTPGHNTIPSLRFDIPANISKRKEKDGIERKRCVLAHHVLRLRTLGPFGQRGYQRRRAGCLQLIPIPYSLLKGWRPDNHFFSFQNEDEKKIGHFETKIDEDIATDTAFSFSIYQICVKRRSALLLNATTIS